MKRSIVLKRWIGAKPTSVHLRRGFELGSLSGYAKLRHFASPPPAGPVTPLFFGIKSAHFGSWAGAERDSFFSRGVKRCHFRSPRRGGADGAQCDAIK